MTTPSSRPFSAPTSPVQSPSAEENPFTAHTTFLTETEDRAPTAYYVAPDGTNRRARQQHDAGARLTDPEMRTHAFVSELQWADQLTTVVKDVSAEFGLARDDALRLQILDGLASPRLRAGYSHVEASRRKTHLSLGSVCFPTPGSLLANFDAVAENTRARSTGEPGAPAPITTSTTGTLTPAAHAFNQTASAEQRDFASAVLRSRPQDAEDA
jgi:hypothetical protein